MLQHQRTRRGWTAWHEQHAEKMRQKRMLAAAGARLARPLLAACFSSWMQLWLAEQKLTATKGLAQLLHEKAWSPPISPRRPATSPRRRFRMSQPDLPQSHRSASARSWRVWSSRSGRSWARRRRRTASWHGSSRRRAIAISPLSSSLPSP